ncbi:TPA: tyrosine-type recombinase/integrase [Bacillus cereus]|uniref:tyrosine-type recombinase/integrase n=1 Tax=Bacillus cereus TaxID=1396 RepID=UPI00065BD307|nr:tyrosine-type recombinase/integrase [Bacillus cereus]KMP51471.1 recombinase XerD [Bacillus cereus]HDR8018737.1 tyrosine-type recombinase/integrase [Bacillus cereus]
MKRRNNDLNVKELAVIHDSVQLDVLDYKTALHLFLNDCELRNLRDHTIRYYRSELTTFYKLLMDQSVSTNPTEITSEVIKKNVIFHMKEVLQRKPVTINTRLRAIRAFFNFLHTERYIKSNPMKDVKFLRVRRQAIPTFSKEQIKVLLKQPDLTTFIGFRDYTVMLLLLETGVRANELVGIAITDIKWEDSFVHIRNTKGYKERLVPIQSYMKEVLRKYVTVRGSMETDALFTSIDNRPMTKRQLQNRISKYGEMANIKDIRCSPHTFRHTFAKLSVQNGAGIFELQQILGHTTMDMVRTYVNLFSNDVKEKHKEFSPLKILNRYK